MARADRYPGRGGFIIPDEDEGWRDRAACRGKMALFFPEDHGDIPESYQEVEWAAKNICFSCPVIESCRHYIDDVELQIGRYGHHGVYAGETPYQRQMRRKRAGMVSANVSYLHASPPDHGELRRYTSWACRCPDCRATMSRYRKERR